MSMPRRESTSYLAPATDPMEVTSLFTIRRISERSGDEIYNATTPGTPEFRCSTGSTQPGTHYSGGTLGTVSTRAQELAGPNSADDTVTVPNGFAPCAYQAPVSGVYGVLFNPATVGEGPNGVIDPPALSKNSVSVWDVTVRSDATSTTDINGRLFTYAFIGFTGGNSRPVYSTHYYVTNDGYRYAQDLRGLDPNGYALYANTFGFLDNGQPLFKDLRGSEALVTTLPPGVTTQTAQFPIFFTDVSPTSPNAAEINRVLGALSIPLTPPTPTVTCGKFHWLYRRITDDARSRRDLSIYHNRYHQLHDHHQSRRCGL